MFRIKGIYIYEVLVKGFYFRLKYSEMVWAEFIDCLPATNIWCNIDTKNNPSTKVTIKAGLTVYSVESYYPLIIKELEMIYRNNVMIKTKFKDVKTLKENFDVTGRSHLFVNGRGKLFSEFEGNQFVITCSGKTSGAFEFIGEVLEEENGIMMQGNIKLREDVMKRHKLMFLFVYAFALVLFLSLNPIFMAMGLLFILMPLINKKFIERSNSLYETLVKRLG